MSNGLRQSSQPLCVFLHFHVTDFPGDPHDWLSSMVCHLFPATEGNRGRDLTYSSSSASVWLDLFFRLGGHMVGPGGTAHTMASLGLSSWREKAGVPSRQAPSCAWFCHLRNGHTCWTPLSGLRTNWDVEFFKMAETRSPIPHFLF